MSNKQVSDKLRDRGFRLVSQNRHKKFRDAQGRTIIMSASPSDVNAEQTQLRDIERIASAPVYVPTVSQHESTALLPRTPKRKAGAGGNHGSNARVATYTKVVVPSVTLEQEEADRLESECNKLKQRMEASFLGFQHQCNVALAFDLFWSGISGKNKDAWYDRVLHVIGGLLILGAFIGGAILLLLEHWKH